MRVSKFVLGTLMVLAMMTSSSAQSALAGAWVMSFNSPNGAIEADATFQQDGDKVSGSIVSPQGEVKFAGTAKGRTFVVSFNIQTQNGDMTIRMDGEVDGDAMKGTFDFGQGTGDYTAKRKK